ncbi:MAG: segregation/condensation protein A, partial [Nitrospinota bacterium]
MIGEDRGLKILVDMAKRGEIDPWNVDIIQVTDRYLALLQAEEFHDLREYGRLLFYASVLLRIKAEVVGGREQTWTDGFDDFIEGDEFDMYAGNGQDLEVDALRARLTFQNGDVGVTPRIPRPRRRPLTLTDLIRELKRMETLQRIHSQ